MKKRSVAMLLAGGQGSRLGKLTSSIAKPAVSFGGKYRIIDFSLSNCVNSGIDTVGILIQYKPMVLNRYVGTGAAWDLDVANGGVHILPPYASQTGGEWYQGTADSIYHNIDFIDVYDPEYVLILSGDHIYKMDYEKMIDFHEANNADLTVSVIEVPWEEASRFGIMTTDDEGHIVQFDEKPAEPKSNLASMGIYVFSWPVLRKALLEDHVAEGSEHDFGKNIIPTLLAQGGNLMAYNFEGYWKDVGTIDSYYECQMEMMTGEVDFDVYDRSSKVFSNSNMYPPMAVGENGAVNESMVCNGCDIYGKVDHSIVGSCVSVGEGSVVKDSIILPNAKIGKNCKIVRSIINEGVVIEDGSVIGGQTGDIQVYGDAKLLF